MQRPFSHKNTAANYSRFANYTQSMRKFDLKVVTASFVRGEETMASHPSYTIRRREFIKLAGAAAALGTSEFSFALPNMRVAVVLDSEIAASAAPAKWAADRLQKAISAKGGSCAIISEINAAHGAGLVVVVGGDQSPSAKNFPAPSLLLNGAESLRLTPGKVAGTPAICGDPSYLGLGD
jgi:hypothetical protein